MMNDSEVKKTKGGRVPGLLPLLYLAISFLVIVTDFTIKQLVRLNIRMGDGYPIIDGILKLTHIENSGAAFSILSGLRIFLIVATLIFIIVLTVLIFFTSEGRSRVFGFALALILGGGAGNLIDRIRFGTVTDYISLKYFAVFNFADIAVSIGCIMMIIYVLLITDDSDETKADS